jgi:hypothetical protein
MKSTNIIYNLRKITQICKQEKPLQQSADRTTEKTTTTTISITIVFCEKSEGKFTTLLVSQEVLKNRHYLLSFRYFLVSKIYS